MIGDKKTRPRRGFTLVEALVTMAIFSVMMIAFSDIYTQNMRYARQIILRAKLQADARNSLEALARAVRVSNIDYSYYAGTLPVQPMTTLALVNPRTGDKSRIWLDATPSECYSDGNNCINVTTDNGVTWAPLSPKGVSIDNLKFYATPSKDPFNFNQSTGQYDSNAQPVVTIVAIFHGQGLSASDTSDQWVYALQTTVTPRLYLR
jgi:prepilin-type N-terminal cleavage/methylation domain-containing protein